jgi:hypothetical protein
MISVVSSGGSGGMRRDRGARLIDYEPTRQVQAHERVPGSCARRLGELVRNVSSGPNERDRVGRTGNRRWRRRGAAGPRPGRGGSRSPRTGRWRARCGLDERVVDALGLEPGEQEVAQCVGADRGGDARGLGVPGQDLADAAVAVGLLPARLEQEHRAGPALGLDMLGEGLLERGGEGTTRSLPPLP